MFSGQLEIKVVSWLIDYGYGLLIDNLVEFIKYNSWFDWVQKLFHTCQGYSSGGFYLK